MFAVIENAVNTVFAARRVLWATVGGWTGAMAGVGGRTRGDGRASPDLRGINRAIVCQALRNLICALDRGRRVLHSAALCQLLAPFFSELASYQSVFGSLAAVIVVMVYVCVSATVFRFGVQLDAIIRAQAMVCERRFPDRAFEF
jgi:hypothetical protein